MELANVAALELLILLLLFGLALVASGIDKLEDAYVSRENCNTKAFLLNFIMICGEVCVIVK